MMGKCANVQMNACSECANVQMCKCANMQMIGRCTIFKISIKATSEAFPPVATKLYTYINI